MASPQMQMQTRDIKGEITTAEVTHLIESYKLESQCYLKNHLLMQMSEGRVQEVIRQWHDSVTRPNLDRIKGVMQEFGVPMPPKKLEDRENSIKEKLSGVKNEIRGVLLESEVLTEVGVAGKYLNEFYTVSFNLATTDRVRDVFRGGRERVADNLVRVEQALRETPEYFPIPQAKQVAAPVGR